MPHLAAHTARRARILHLEHGATAFIRRKHGVGLILVPQVIHRVPLVVAAMEDLRLNAACTIRFASLHFKGQRLGQHRALRETPRAFLVALVTVGLVVTAKLCLAGQSHEPLGVRVIVPSLRVDGVGQHPVCRLQGFNIGKQAGLAELLRKTLAIGRSGVFGEPINWPVVVNDIQLTLRVDTKADDA